MRQRRLLLFGLPVVAVVTGILLLVYANWVLQGPSVDDPQGDAVIVHAGRPGRLRHAIRLMDRGAATTLVIMFGEDSRRGRYCGLTDPYEVLCPEPEPATTVGEARVVADLVDERGWTTVVAVTSDYHLRRATYLDAKCSGAEVLGSGSGQGARRQVIMSLAEEMVAMVPAWLTGC